MIIGALRLRTLPVLHLVKRIDIPRRWYEAGLPSCWTSSSGSSASSWKRTTNCGFPAVPTGFRRRRLPHGANRSGINWTGTTWFVEGDISTVSGAWTIRYFSRSWRSTSAYNRFLRLIKQMSNPDIWRTGFANATLSLRRADKVAVLDPSSPIFTWSLGQICRNSSHARIYTRKRQEGQPCLAGCQRRDGGLAAGYRTTVQRAYASNGGAFLPGRDHPGTGGPRYPRPPWTAPARVHRTEHDAGEIRTRLVDLPGDYLKLELE